MAWLEGERFSSEGFNKEIDHVSYTSYQGFCKTAYLPLFTKKSLCKAYIFGILEKFLI